MTSAGDSGYNGDGYSSNAFSYTGSGQVSDVGATVTDPVANTSVGASIHQGFDYNGNRKDLSVSLTYMDGTLTTTPDLED
jgi:hypothetical protein